MAEWAQQPLAYCQPLFTLAQRLFCAAAIRARPSGENVRFFGAATAALGRPGRRLVTIPSTEPLLEPVNSLRAVVSLAISRSMAETMLAMFMVQL